MSESTPVPYKIIASCFRDHTVVPFLGAGASVAGVSAGELLPTGAEFARFLAEQSTYPGAASDPLTKVAQYLEEVAGDRKILLSTVFSRFCTEVDKSYKSSVMDFFEQIQPGYVPELIVTTNYDCLLETILEKKHLPYLAICHIMKGSKFAGRLLCYRSVSAPLTPESIQTVRQVETLITDLMQPDPTARDVRGMADKPVLLYKMHGTAWMKDQEKQTIDSLVLTENDYVDFFAQDVLNRIPAMILEMLRTRRFLFMGYSLEDWNFRVLLKKLQSVQRKDAESPNRNWAFLMKPDPVETRFWERRGVNLYEQRLEQVLQLLGQELRS